MTTAALDLHPSAPKVSTRQAFRPDVQGLRAVAVGLVVLSHAGVKAASGGFVGVDVFFVISGFLITGLLLTDAAEHGRISFATFYTRRALRILPAATVVIVATMLVSNQALNFLQARAMRTDGIWATFFAANVHFGLEGTDYFAADQWLSPLQHYWSLAVEEQFYLVWPALLALVLFGVHGIRARRGAGKPHRRALLKGRVVLALVVVGAASLYISVHQTVSDPTLAYFSTFARGWELAAGALLATVLPAVAKLPSTLRAALSWAGVAGICVAAVTFNTTTPFPGNAALLPVLSACAVIAGGVGTPERGAWRLLGTRPFRFIGDISYSLYLWHWPVLILGAAYVGHAPSVVQNLGLVVVALVLSVASYHGIENPFRRARWIWGSRPRNGMLLYPIAVVSVLLVALLAQPASPFVARAAQGQGSMPVGEVRAAVATSVAAAQRGAPIPAGLSPSIDKVKADLKSLGPCSGYNQTSSKICQYGDPQGSKRMVAFGNSHSTMWVPSLAADSKKAHWQFFPVIKEACGYHDFTGDPARSQCGAWYAWAKKTIRTMHPDLIVISVFVDHAWDSGVRQMIKELKAPGTRVLLMSDVPGVNVAPVACLLARDATQKACLWPQRAKYLNADVTARSIARQANIEFVNVSPWFCYQRMCPTVIGSTVAYADAGHISGTYARYLAPYLAPYLKLT